MRIGLAVFFISFILVSAVEHASGSETCPARPVLQQLRYDEDWSFLANAECRSEPLDNIKYVPLGREGWFLSAGGETRLRYENYQNPAFGSDPADENGYLLQRYLLHADVHFGERFRFFVQLQSGLEDGRNGGPRLTDEDILDLHQAFGELVLLKDTNSRLALRIGRQEVEFGAGRLIGASEGLNPRRAFDGGA
ncbi:MAG TPA: alginate export family protein [Candidatus Angelobacter sp.]|nr:alginate export family protein [Candidatus Angelobacter sp.]